MLQLQLDFKLPVMPPQHILFCLLFMFRANVILPRILSYEPNGGTVHSLLAKLGRNFNGTVGESALKTAVISSSAASTIVTDKGNASPGWIETTSRTMTYGDQSLTEKQFRNSNSAGKNQVEETSRNRRSGVQNRARTPLKNRGSVDLNLISTTSRSISVGAQAWTGAKFTNTSAVGGIVTKKLYSRLTSGMTHPLRQREAFKVASLDVVQEEGYSFEEHFVTTADGYILALHRVSGSRRSFPASVSARKPVLLMHGLFLSSLSFFALGPRQSLGYLLADAGFDVWAGNFRGNTYGRNHTRLNPDSDPSFWQFGQDEMARHDLKAIVDYVISTTGARILSYVGYSQGGRTGLMAATDLKWSQKVDLLVVLGSTGARTLLGLEAKTSRLLGDAWKFLEAVGKWEIVSYNSKFAQIISSVCTTSPFLRTICTDALSKSSGRRLFRDDLYEYRREILPVILAHIFSGSSARQFSHQAQLSDGVLRKFDYGPAGNLQHYGTTTTPEYNLRSVQCPVAVYWASNDNRTPIEDVERISKQIPNVAKSHQVSSDSFNHLDFIFAEKAKNLLYDNIIDLLNQYR